MLMGVDDEEGGAGAGAGAPALAAAATKDIDSRVPAGGRFGAIKTRNQCICACMKP